MVDSCYTWYYALWLLIWLLVARCSGVSRELIMTPFWNLTFAEGESVTVDCGVDNKGRSTSVSILWYRKYENGTR